MILLQHIRKVVKVIDFLFSASESPWKPKRHAGGANIFVPKNKYEELILVTICFYIDLKEIINNFNL